MEILITGSRKLDPKEVYKLLKKELHKHTPETILHGGAKGADQASAMYAKDKGIAEIVLRPAYSRYPGNVAPLMRNTELVKLADLVIGIYAPSRERQGGTWDTVQKAIRSGKPVIELFPDGRRVETSGQSTLF